MNYTIFPTKRFLKALERRKKGGRKDIVDAAGEVMDLLAQHDDRSLFVLHTRWRDHALKGNLHGMRELHLAMDDLLIYRVDEEARAIDLLNIVSHEELRKNW